MAECPDKDVQQVHKEVRSIKTEKVISSDDEEDNNNELQIGETNCELVSNPENFFPFGTEVSFFLPFGVADNSIGHNDEEDVNPCTGDDAHPCPPEVEEPSYDEDDTKACRDKYDSSCRSLRGSKLLRPDDVHDKDVLTLPETCNIFQVSPLDRNPLDLPQPLRDKNVDSHREYDKSLPHSDVEVYGEEAGGETVKISGLSEKTMALTDEENPSRQSDYVLSPHSPLSPLETSKRRPRVEDDEDGEREFEETQLQQQQQQKMGRKGQKAEEEPAKAEEAEEGEEEEEEGAKEGAKEEAEEEETLGEEEKAGAVAEEEATEREDYHHLHRQKERIEEGNENGNDSSLDSMMNTTDQQTPTEALVEQPSCQASDAAHDSRNANATTRGKIQIQDLGNTRSITRKTREEGGNSVACCGNSEMSTREIKAGVRHFFEMSLAKQSQRLGKKELAIIRDIRSHPEGKTRVFPFAFPVFNLSFFLTPTVAPMHWEIFRLGSFLTYPQADRHSTLRLANAGFYYPGQGHDPECYLCGVAFIQDGRNREQDPYDLHRARNPFCPFAVGDHRSNVFIQAAQTQARSGRDITGGYHEPDMPVTEQVQTIRESVNAAVPASRHTEAAGANDFPALEARSTRRFTGPSSESAQNRSIIGQEAERNNLRTAQGAHSSFSPSPDRQTGYAAQDQPIPAHRLLSRENSDVDEDDSLDLAGQPADGSSMDGELQRPHDAAALFPEDPPRSPSMAPRRLPRERRQAERREPSQTAENGMTVEGPLQSGARADSRSRGRTSDQESSTPPAAGAPLPLPGREAAGWRSRGAAPLPSRPEQPPNLDPPRDAPARSAVPQIPGSHNEVQDDHGEANVAQGAEGGTEAEAAEILTCRVCLVNIAEYTFVPCGHTACEECSRRLLLGPCHMCRTHTQDRVHFHLNVAQASGGDGYELAIDYRFFYSLRDWETAQGYVQLSREQVWAIQLAQGTWRTPRHPDMASADVRLRTMLGQQGQSPPFLPQLLRECAEAGFFLQTPRSVELVCYHCGNGISDWPGGPWAAHARFFPNCRHLRHLRRRDD